MAWLLRGIGTLVEGLGVQMKKPALERFGAKTRDYGERLSGMTARQREIAATKRAIASLSTGERSGLEIAAGVVGIEPRAKNRGLVKVLKTQLARLQAEEQEDPARWGLPAPAAPTGDITTERRFRKRRGPTMAPPRTTGMPPVSYPPGRFGRGVADPIGRLGSLTGGLSADAEQDIADQVALLSQIARNTAVEPVPVLGN